MTVATDNASLAPIIDALEGDPQDRIAAIRKLGQDANEWADRMSTTVQPDASRLTRAGTITLMRDNLDEFSGTFQQMLEKACEWDVAVGLRVEVITEGPNELSRTRYTGTLHELDGTNLIFADDVTVDRETILAFAVLS